MATFHNTTVGSKTKDLKDLAAFQLSPLTSMHLITPTRCHWIGVFLLAQSSLVAEGGQVAERLGNRAINQKVVLDFLLQSLKYIL